MPGGEITQRGDTIFVSPRDTADAAALLRRLRDRPGAEPSRRSKEFNPALWRRLPGKDRHYIFIPTGEIVSYYRYLNIQRGVTPFEYALERRQRRVMARLIFECRNSETAGETPRHVSTEWFSLRGYDDADIESMVDPERFQPEGDTDSDYFSDCKIGRLLYVAYTFQGKPVHRR